MYLSDNNLCMLEQLCYLNGDVAKAAGLDGFSTISKIDIGKNVGSIIEQFDDKCIENLRNYSGVIDGAKATGKEWAGIITYIKSRVELTQLIVKDIMQKPNKESTIGICFANESDDKAIVAFKGTSGKREWVDDFDGFIEADTECQKEALDFVEGLEYDDLTVVGHSKGGNKAMYVTVLSDKVSRCLSLDGQGFSNEFLDKYAEEIDKNAEKINNFSLRNDYVHTLMKQIPGAKQTYFQGYNVDTAEQNHSPNSFFAADEDGNIYVDDHGNLRMTVAKEDESMSMLHKFSLYLMDIDDAEEKKDIVEYLGPLIAGLMCGDEGASEQLLNEPIMLLKIVGYLVSFAIYNNLTKADISSLLISLNLNDINNVFTIVTVAKHIFDLNVTNDAIDLTTLIFQLEKADSKEEYIEIIKNNLERTDSYVDAELLYNLVSNNLNNIIINNRNKALFESQNKIKQNVIYDYSTDVYYALLSTIRSIDKMSFDPAASWKKYKCEGWFSSLLITTASKFLKSYFTEITQVNNICEKEITNIFIKAEKNDKMFEAKLNAEKKEIDNISKDFKLLLNNINF